MAHKKPSHHFAPHQRRTLALRGTVSRIEAQLDHPAHLAVAYARHWLKAGPGQMGVDVFASGVIRRSLDVYMHHLSSAGIDPAQEARAVRSCCSAPVVDDEDREAAWKRLQAHEEDHPPPPWPDVLHGPDSASKWVALDARVDALVDQMNREKTQQMNKGRNTTS